MLAEANLKASIEKSEIAFADAVHAGVNRMVNNEKRGIVTSE